MEKKMYEELNLEVVRFDAEDVVATSGEGEPISDCPHYCAHENTNWGEF